MKRRLSVERRSGILSQLAAIGLLLTSAWLIVRAAEQPPVLYLMVAIVSVRFFGLGRAVLRYVERLLTHDVALARVTEARVAAYRDLDRVAPVGMAGRRRGDLVSRVVADVDSAQDRMLRSDPVVVRRGATTTAVTISARVHLPRLRRSSTAAHAAISYDIDGPSVRLPGGQARGRSQPANSRGGMAAKAAMLAAALRDIVAYGAAARSAETGRIHRPPGGRPTKDGMAGWPGICLGAAVHRRCDRPHRIVDHLNASGHGRGPVLAPLALLEPLLSVVDAERLRPTIEESQRRLDQLSNLHSPVVEPETDRNFRTHLRCQSATWSWVGTDPHRADQLRGRPGRGARPPRSQRRRQDDTLTYVLDRSAARTGSGVLTIGDVDYAELAVPTPARRWVGLAGQDDVMFDTSIRENLRVGDRLGD